MSRKVKKENYRADFIEMCLRKAFTGKSVKRHVREDESTYISLSGAHCHFLGNAIVPFNLEEPVRFNVNLREKPVVEFFDRLKRRLADRPILDEVKVGGLYQHYKGGVYCVKKVFFDETNTPRVVMYREATGKKRLWHRPYRDFVDGRFIVIDTSV